MTAPRQPPEGQIRASRRRAAAPAAPSEPYSDAEIGRGQADAVLGALGRMQLRLDLLAREQGDALDRIMATLDRLTARLDEYEFEVSYEQADATDQAGAADPPASAPTPPSGHEAV